MYLCIDNSSEERIVLKCKVAEQWEERVVDSAARQRVLRAIEETLRGFDKRLTDLKGILVVVGKGRFTATRVATTVANTLALALQIPVGAVSDSDNTRLEQALGRLFSHGHYISAQYSGEAHIGKK